MPLGGAPGCNQAATSSPSTPPGPKLRVIGDMTILIASVSATTARTRRTTSTLLGYTASANTTTAQDETAADA